MSGTLARFLSGVTASTVLLLDLAFLRRQGGSHSMQSRYANFDPVKTNTGILI